MAPIGSSFLPRHRTGVTWRALVVSLALTVATVSSAIGAARRAEAWPAAPPAQAVSERIADLAFELDYDMERIFRFMADEIRYEPYEGILREHTFLAGPKQRVGQVQFSFLNGNKVLSLTFTDLEERIAQSRAVGLEIFQKLQIRPSADGFKQKQKMMELNPKAEEAELPEKSGEKLSVPKGNVKG